MREEDVVRVSADFEFLMLFCRGIVHPLEIELQEGRREM